MGPKIPQNGEPLRAARRHISTDLAAVPSTGPASAAAFDAHALYERQYPLVLRFCRSKLRSREDAEDAAQTTFYYALGSLRRGTVPTTETAWLLTIARNVCLNRWDAARRRSRVEVARDPHVLQEVAPGREDGDGELIGLQDALGRLTEPQRRAILLREWQGLSYAEIAAELDLSEGAVETLLFRARRALARELRGGRSLRDVGSLLGGLKSLLGGAGALKVAVGVAAVVAVGVAAAPRFERTHARPAPSALSRVAAHRSPLRVARSSAPGHRATTPSARQLARPVRAAPAPSGVLPYAPASSAGAGTVPPTAVPPTQTPAPPATATARPAAQPAPTEPIPSPPAPTVPPAPSVEVPSLPVARPSLPTPPSVSVPSIPALPVAPPTVTVPLPKLP